MTTEKQTFLRAERDAMHKFMRKHINDDFLSPSSVSYSRKYNCECGFTTATADAIYDHCQAAWCEAAQRPVNT